ncbi:hypothetical protein [Photobacterium atrarenae]|uniref:Uncharacterized protein n=1 Tax=Photobacterium atrarenae TaxID=865757 RepID=A0ABY5GGU6_9GAMM|nr:hypothetical protein [Photobacterium atrarenae]UTV28401.1 hypothetical protein NNL38_03885 [Photobacterium atrarenae]
MFDLVSCVSGAQYTEFCVLNPSAGCCGSDGAYDWMNRIVLWQLGAQGQYME